MATNKVVYGNTTLIDLTSDTVTPSDVLEGVTFHDRGGALRAGTAVIPEVNDATLTIQRNGSTVATFTANDDTDKTANIIVDSWTATSQVANDEVTFTGLDDIYGYELYCQDKLIGVSAMTKTGSGSNVTLTYTVTGAAAGDYCKLRILK